MYFRSKFFSARYWAARFFGATGDSGPGPEPTPVGIQSFLVTVTTASGITALTGGRGDVLAHAGSGIASQTSGSGSHDIRVPEGTIIITQ